MLSRKERVYMPSTCNFIDTLNEYLLLFHSVSLNHSLTLSLSLSSSSLFQYPCWLLHLMRPWEQSLIRLYTKEQYQIVKISPNRINTFKFSQKRESKSHKELRQASRARNECRRSRSVECRLWGLS